MTAYIALFRGINVGGRNILPMKELRAELESLGCKDVRTYIQSGNAVFRHAKSAAPGLAESIRSSIRASHGFEPAVLLVTADHLEAAVRSNPFPEGTADPSKLHLFFLSTTPGKPDLEAIETIRAGSESFALLGEVAYLHAPEGIARSKLASRAERLLGVQATARNWRSVTKILEMARQEG